MRRRTGLMTCLRVRGLRDLGRGLGIPALMGARRSGLDGTINGAEQSRLHRLCSMIWNLSFIHEQDSLHLPDYWAFL